MITCRSSRSAACRRCASHHTSYSSLPARREGDLRKGLSPVEMEPMELMVPRAGKSIPCEPPSELAENEPRRLRGGGGILTASPVIGFGVGLGRGRAAPWLMRPMGPEALARMAASEEEIRPGLPPSCDGPWSCEGRGRASSTVGEGR